MAGSRRERAQRRLPSMMIATCRGSRAASSVTPCGGCGSTAISEPLVAVVADRELEGAVVRAVEDAHPQQAQHAQPQRGVGRGDQAEAERAIRERGTGARPREHDQVFDGRARRACRAWIGGHQTSMISFSLPPTRSSICLMYLSVSFCT